MYHKVVLIGRLGGDPEMRYTPSGTAVTNFSVATSTRISKENTPECPDGWKEAYNGKAWELTTWFRVTAWRGLAETTNAYLAKGRQVYIEGELNGTTADGSRYPRVWTGQDGVPRASFEITARTVKFLGSSNGNSSDAPQQDEPPPGHVEENAIPF
ncbi:MAG: single-stranded DNA-binding protein [Anaerolineae bacterium]|nr:single-stranded DNA-binding protein [Anaerolineae bacterium]